MSDEFTCIGNTDDPDCDQRTVWCRSTQFAGDHYFCAAHARREKDFGQVDVTGGQFVWHRVNPDLTLGPAIRSVQDFEGFVMHVDKPFSVREFMDKARAAGHDALGIANDPEAIALIEAGKGVTSLAAAAKARELVNMPTEPINHHTRAPNQPSEATIVEGEYCNSNNDPGAPVPYVVILTRKGPGQVEFTLKIDGEICGQVPFDNLVKAATRIDPDHATGTEKQIRQLRQEAAEAKAQMYDWQAKAMQLEEKTTQLEEKLRAFQEAAKA